VQHDWGRPRGSAFFTCSNCGALYQLVRGEAGLESVNREVACRSCDAPMPGRDGQFVLKYFHLRNASRYSRREKGKRS
jgi:DNA-directed RNA polymerase subunit RPC12/RpoP